MKSENENMLASVDLGSNSFRLQICKNHNGQLQIIDSIKEMVQLAAGLDSKKHLSEEAQARALACLARFGERLRGWDAEQIRAVATNTFRIAKNIGEFLPKAEAALGFPIEIIAGREEARLIYTGVIHTLPPQKDKILVVDIGGGSTEFIIGTNLRPDITESLPLGCVSYSMRFFGKEKITRENFRKAVDTAKLEIQRISGALRDISWHSAIGTSGSARSIRDIMAMRDPQNETIRPGHLQTLAEEIFRAGNTHAARLDGLKADREAVFAGGLAVMTAVFEELGIGEMQIIDAALRDGVFYDLVGRHLNQDMREETVAQFQTRYHVDTAQAARIEKTALLFLGGLALQMGETQSEYWQRFVSWAARVHEIGLSIAYIGYHKHSAYILENADMPGFSRKDQKILATLVLGHRGDLKKMRGSLKDPIFGAVMMCLRLAALLCRARTDIVFPENTSIQMNAEKKRFLIKISREWLAQNPLTAGALDLESAAWQKIGWHLTVQTLSADENGNA